MTHLLPSCVVRHPDLPTIPTERTRIRGGEARTYIDCLLCARLRETERNEARKRKSALRKQPGGMDYGVIALTWTPPERLMLSEAS